MDWGLCARSALLCCIVNISDTFTSKLQWQWLSQQLSNLNTSSETSDILTQQYIILGQAKVNCVLGNVSSTKNYRSIVSFVHFLLLRFNFRKFLM